jgi:phosphatidylinositol alpha-1,6-mannosyltransferase
MKRVLFISSEFPPGPGGIGQHAFDLSKNITSHLHYHLTILTTKDYADNIDIKDFENEHCREFKLYRFPRVLSGLNQGIRYLITLWIILYNNYDYAIFSGRLSIHLNLFLKHILELKKIKTICIVHGSEINPVSKLEKFLNQRGISCANIIVAVSEFTKQLLLKQITNKEIIQRIVLIPNGLSQFTISNWNNSQSNFVPKYFRDAYPNLITVGNVIPRKGQQNVIRALPKIIKQFPKVRYHIVGTPFQKEILKELAKECGVLENVIFHGKIKNHADLANYYKSSDILMLLSENLNDGDVEGYGIVVLEANYFSVPAIGSLGTGVEQAIKKRYNGVLVSSKDEIQIVNAITEILDNEAFRENSQSWAQLNSWENIIHQYKFKVFEV